MKQLYQLPQGLNLKPNQRFIYNAVVALEHTTFKTLEDRIREIAYHSFSSISTVRNFIHNPKNHLVVNKTFVHCDDVLKNKMQDQYFLNISKVFYKAYALIQEGCLKPIDILLYLTMSNFHNQLKTKQGEQAQLFVGQKKLATWLNVDAQTIRESLKRLRRLGIISWKVKDCSMLYTYTLISLKTLKKTLLNKVKELGVIFKKFVSRTIVKATKIMQFSTFHQFKNTDKIREFREVDVNREDENGIIHCSTNLVEVILKPLNCPGERLVKEKTKKRYLWQI